MTDLFDLIRSDHQLILSGLVRLFAIEDRSKCEEELSKIAGRLLAHMNAEETVFYPLLSEDADDPEPVFEAMEEHRAGRCLLADARDIPASDPRWRARVKVLYDLLERHIREEENELFAQAREALNDEDLLRVGVEFMAAEKAIPAGRPV